MNESIRDEVIISISIIIIIIIVVIIVLLTISWGPLHKTFTGEKTLVKSENCGKNEFTIDFTIG